MDLGLINIIQIIDNLKNDRISIKSIEESSEDGEYNTVTFSDDQTLKIKNGNKGMSGVYVGTAKPTDDEINIWINPNGLPTDIPVVNGKDGYSPIKGVDYFTEAEKKQMIQEVLNAMGTPVVGTVDENNTITLSNTLKNGTYTLKYTDDKGNDIEVGTITINSGSGGGETEDPTEIINLIDEVGYTNNVRWSATNQDYTPLDGYVTTGQISVYPRDIIRTKGVNFDEAEKDFCSFHFITNAGATSFMLTNSQTGQTLGLEHYEYELDENNNLTITFKDDYLKSIRLIGFGQGENLIVTRNQEII